MEIDKELYNEIKEYCKLNGINAREYIHKLLKKAFMVDKYGEVPPIFVKQEEKTVEAEEKPVEKRNFNELYENIAKTDEFKKAYVGKSLGEFIPVENSVVEPKKIVPKPRKRKLN